MLVFLALFASLFTFFSTIIPAFWGGRGRFSVCPVQFGHDCNRLVLMLIGSASSIGKHLSQLVRLLVLRPCCLTNARSVSGVGRTSLLYP